MDCAGTILHLKVAATETEFIEVLKNLMALKALSKEVSVKISGSKAELIGWIITYWECFLLYIHTITKKSQICTNNYNVRCYISKSNWQ